MSGDHWREARDHKRRVRATWEECPYDGSKVPPGGDCLRCGWKAPEAYKPSKVKKPSERTEK